MRAFHLTMQHDADGDATVPAPTPQQIEGGQEVNPLEDQIGALRLDRSITASMPGRTAALASSQSRTGSPTSPMLKEERCNALWSSSMGMTARMISRIESVDRILGTCRAAEAHAHGGLPDTRGSCDHHEARAPSHQHSMESTFHEACDHRLTEQRVSTSEAWTDHERERADEHRR